MGSEHLIHRWGCPAWLKDACLYLGYCAHLSQQLQTRLRRTAKHMAEEPRPALKEDSPAFQTTQWPE